MQPTYEELLKFKGAEFELSNLGTPVGEFEGQLLEKRNKATLNSVLGKKLVLANSEAVEGGEKGLWVPYAPKAAFYGFIEDGETWAGSGPFSGCDIVLGKRGVRFYLAHLSAESGSNAKAIWADRNWDDDEVVGQWTVPLPSVDFFSASHIFIDWSQGEDAMEISRIDIKCKAMASAYGEIYNVVKMSQRC